MIQTEEGEAVKTGLAAEQQKSVGLEEPKPDDFEGSGGETDLASFGNARGRWMRGQRAAQAKDTARNQTLRKLASAMEPELTV